jgi:hypothetical protein
MLLDNVYYTVVNENDIWVRGSLSSTNNDIAQRYTFETASTTNKQFNFAGAYMFASTTPNIISEYRKGYFLNSDGDDATPVNTKNAGYVGANHGLVVSQVTSNNHDKTIEDIGS